MAISYRLDPEKSIVWVFFSGDVTASEFESAMQRLCTDPSIPNGIGMIVDQSELDKAPSVSVVGVAPPLLMRIARDKEIVRCATVAPRDAIFGVNRMLEVYAERTPVTLRAFRGVDLALAWIRLDSSDA